MESGKRLVKTIARKYSMDSDGLLIYLWDLDDKRYGYLRNEQSIIRGKRDLRDITRIIESRSAHKVSEPTISTSNIPSPRFRDYDFSLIGKRTETITHLSFDEVMAIYDELVRDFSSADDPIDPAGLRDRNLLESALFHPQTSYCGEMKYPTVESSGAALMYSISNNHAFHNGNKRAALVSLLVFLERHGRNLLCDEDELFKISVKVAAHKLISGVDICEDAEIYELARWIHSSSKIVKREERAISLRKLKQILTDFDCIIDVDDSVKRVVKGKNFWTRDRVLESKGLRNLMLDEGTEVDKGRVRSIRKDLELDPEHMVDSDAFYATAEYSSSEFIARYKTLLKRLALR